MKKTLFALALSAHLFTPTAHAYDLQTCLNRINYGLGDVNYHLGSCYGMFLGEEKALGYYEKGSEIGEIISMKTLARYYEDRDPKRSFEQIKRCSEFGDEECAEKLPYLYAYGRGTKKSYKKAVELLSKLAEKNPHHYSGLYQIAVEYKRPKEAVAFLQKGVKHDCGQCYTLLGIYYEYGGTVKRNIKKAVNLYDLGCISGYDVGCERATAARYKYF